VITWDEFIRIVDKDFKYLETEFGFKRISTDMPFIKYESSHIQIKVYYDINRHHELDLGIRPFKKIDKFGTSYGIGLLVRLYDPGYKAKYQISPFPKTIDEIQCSVKELSEMLKKYGSSLLKGDMTDIERMQKIEDNWNKSKLNIKK
jgi:hypothetical protein